MLLHLAITQVWREKNNPEFRILGFALWLAVFAVTVLTCLTYALRALFVGEAANLLGADLILESAIPLNPQYSEYAKSHNMEATAMVEFFSMVLDKENIYLSSVYAFDATFPLRGELTVLTFDNQTHIKSAPPLPGQIWIEESLAQKLDAKINDIVTVGNAKMKITGILHQHPIAVSDSSALAPVGYVNAFDLAELGVLQPGSRLTFRLLLAGTQQQLKDFREHFKDAADVSWVTPEKGRQAVSRTLTVGKRYLAIILLIQVFLAGTAIAMCAHQYSMHQHKSVAIWRCIGATTGAIVHIQVLALLLFALFTTVLSVGAGYLTAMLILYYGQQFGLFGLDVGWQGIFLGSLTGLVMLFGFAIPPILQLKRVSPMQIIQQQQQEFTPTVSLGSYAASIFSLMILFVFLLGDIEVALRLSCQFIIITGLAFTLIWGVWYGLVPMSKWGKITWRFGLSHMIRHKWQSVTQSLVFTMVIMFLLLVQIIQQDFIKLWKSQLPISTPNYFLLNIQPVKVGVLQDWLEKHGVKEINFYPVVRARMSHINNVPISINPKENEAQGLSRPINLTWMKHLPKDNKVVAGEDWEKVGEGQPVISIEKGFADRQHVKMGDTLSFQVGEQTITGKIVQIRTVEWETFKPNFFVIFPPKVLEDLPFSYISSIYFPHSQKDIIYELAKKNVEMSVIDIDFIIQKVQQMIKKISIALNVVFVLVFIMGILIMYASLLSTLKERLNESAMLKILGASKWFVARVLLTEFGVLGLFCGSLASLIALVIAKDIARYFFELPFSFSFKWIGWGILFSTTLIVAFGLVGARAVFRASPLLLLRETK